MTQKTVSARPGAPQVNGAVGDLPTSPSRETFLAAYATGTAQILATRLVADLETPVSAYLKLSGGGALSFLLESVEGGATRGRYSIIGAHPDVIWRASGTTAEINRTPEQARDAFLPEAKPTLDALRDLLAESAIPERGDLPPMAAGVFGYMGYDTVRLIEHLPNQPDDDLNVPDAVMMRPTLMVIFDSVRDEMTIATPVRPTTHPDLLADEAYELAVGRLRDAVAALQSPLPQLALQAGGEHAGVVSAPDAVSNTSEERYLEMVAKAQEYIKAGDIFQVVLAQRFTSDFSLPPFALYRSLRRLNPSPFLFHLDFGDFALVGSSPEILVRCLDGEVTIRPIAGTRKRGANAAEDAVLEAELLADPKERAEHLMLLDLGRNDVGRVSLAKTVEVTGSFFVERYSHVMHIVSNVIGKLNRQTHDEVDALMAGFPAGTVSGAPKVRAMEVIDELEAAKRGPYAGCVGYFSADGNMDTCIVLRTALVKDGKLHVQAGAGIVHDSVPSSEQQECINKAMAIIRAAEEAVAFAGGAGHSPKGGNKGLFG